MRNEKGATGPGPINSDGTTLNPSSFWHTGIDRTLADKMQQRMAEDTYSRIHQGSQLITQSENNAPVLQAKFEMAQRFRYGWGVNEDRKKALELYQSAATAGHPQAGYELARLYIQGNTLMGIEKNLNEAKTCIETTISAYNELGENVQRTLRQEKHKEQLENLASVVNCYQNNISIGF